MPRQFICEHCANINNGRITHRHRDGFITDTLLDGKTARNYRTSPSRERNCTECRKRTRYGWRHES